MTRPIFCVLFTTGLFLNSCCKQVCPSVSLGLSFVDFKNTDVDTLLVKRYPSGTNFSTAIDSFYTFFQQPQMDTMYLFLTDSVPLTNDYEINLPAINRTFKISNIAAATERCACGGQSHKIVQSCLVDGIESTGQLIYLHK